MEMTKDVFDEYGNYKYPDYANSQYTHDVSTTGGAMMEMTIDDCIKELLLNKEDDTYVLENETIDFAIETMRKYQKIQDEYENRLKADMAAMLTEIQLEIEELDISDVVPEYQDGEEETKEYIANMIEEKINSLKED